MGLVWIRRVLVMAMLMALSGGLLPVSATAGGGCVSRPEYRRAEIGMRKARVHRIFDTRGEVIAQGPHREERAYDICRKYEGVVVFVTYKNNRLVTKSWLYGE